MPEDSKVINSQELISNLSFCVFDLETTGGNHKSDKIIEIGLVKVEKLKIVEERNYLIKPDMKIPDFIQKLTNISAKDVENAPRIEDVIEEIIAFMGDSILVAHNISFDIPFFNSVLKRLGIPELGNNGLCTNLMTKYLIPNLLNTNLNTMSHIFNIKHKNAHRALDDARATAELLLKYLEIFIAKNIPKINHLYYPRNRYELDRAHYKRSTADKIIFDKLQSIKTPYLITIKGKEGIIMDCLACDGPLGVPTYLKTKIKELAWENITINLFGTLMEAFIHYAGPYSKLDQETKHHSLNQMIQLHFKGKLPPPQSNEDPHDLTLSSSKLGDFCILNHLVPEQYVIFPIAGLHPKSQLIFRYPAHQKKLLQFINSKASRLTSNKFKKMTFPAAYKEFLVAYIMKSKEEGSGPLFFEKSLPKKSPEIFDQKLLTYFEQNAFTLKYPVEYL